LTINIKIQRLPGNADIPYPSKKTIGSAGMDVCAAISSSLKIEKNQIKLVPLGFRLSIPIDYEAQIRPRSGLSLNHGITVLNSPGTIDSDYRGEVGVILINLGEHSYTLKRGDRVAQLVFSKIINVNFEETQIFSDTARNEDGFGSTGSSF
tara:strand:+ start:682 stop:1134 length:453 start_codon:yes stop_codon:yes gene_type:complete